MKPSERKKTLVRKWGMRAAVAAGDESSSAFEEARKTRATPPVRNLVESNVRSRRDLNHCVAEGGADADLFCFQTSLERYFYRCELGLQVARVTLVCLIVVLVLSFSHYGFDFTRRTLSGLEVWLCDVPLSRISPQRHLVDTSLHQQPGDVLVVGSGHSPQPTTTTTAALDGNDSLVEKDVVFVDPATITATPTVAPVDGLGQDDDGDAMGWCIPSLAFRAVGWLEYNPALLATTVFARPWIQVFLVVAIVLVSRAKRLSKLEPSRHIVDRMNKEVLQPVLGIKYDVDSNLLLVQAFE